VPYTSDTCGNHCNKLLHIKNTQVPYRLKGKRFENPEAFAFLIKVSVISLYVVQICLKYECVLKEVYSLNILNIYIPRRKRVGEIL